MPLLITGSVLSPVDQRSYKTVSNALLYVGEDGLIKAIRQIASADGRTAPGEVNALLEEVGHRGELERLDLTRGEFLIPGFVDTHTVRVHRRHAWVVWLSPCVAHSMARNTRTSEQVSSTSS